MIWKDVSTMEEKKNRSIGSVINMANMIVSLILGMVCTPVIVRYMGDSEYGIYTLAMSLIAYLSVLDLGFGNALVRYTAKARAIGKSENKILGLFFSFYIIVAFIAAVVGAILYNYINAFFATSFSLSEINILQKVFIIMLCNAVVSFPCSVFSSIISSHERFIYANVLNFIKNIFSHVLMIILVLEGFKSVALAVTSLIITIVVAMINAYYCFSKLNISIEFGRFEGVFYSEVAVYSFFILLNIIVDQLYASTDKIILGKVCGSVAVAVYGIGVTFQSYFQNFSISISGVFLPYITKLSVGENSKEKMSNTFLRVGHIQLILLSFILAGFLAFGKSFIELWVGKNYYDSYYIALIIMAPAIVPLSQNIGISILQALNKHRIRSVMYLCIAFINVAISIPLAIKFGGIGSAFGTAVGNLLGQIMFMNWYYWKRIGIDIPTYWKNFLILIIQLIPVWLVFRLIVGVPLYRWKGLIIKIIIGLICVMPYYYLVILNQEEKRIVLDLLKRFIKRKNNK